MSTGKVSQSYDVTSQQLFSLENLKKAISNPSLGYCVLNAQLKDKFSVAEYTSRYLNIADGGFTEYPSTIEDYSEWSWQFEFLKEHGLDPESRLLDIGCGYLRGGVQFIPFLKTGRYYGMDISQDAIRESKTVIDEYDLSDKDPTVFRNDDLKFREEELDGVTFDYVLAQSVITHLPPADVEELLANLHRILDDDGVLLATYHKSPDDTVKQFARIVDFGYPWSFFEDLSETYGLQITELDGDHPKGHSLLKVSLD